MRKMIILLGSATKKTLRHWVRERGLEFSEDGFGGMRRGVGIPIAFDICVRGKVKGFPIPGFRLRVVSLGQNRL